MLARLLGNCFRARRAGKRQHAGGRRGVRGADFRLRSFTTPRYENSSSTTAASHTSHGGVMPSSCSDVMAFIIAASPHFVSQLPRPNSLPPSMRGSNGAMLMPFTDTVSMCALRITRRDGSRPGSRAITFGLPEKTSCSRVTIPRCSKNSRTNVATSRSPRPALVKRVHAVDANEGRQSLNRRRITHAAASFGSSAARASKNPPSASTRRLLTFSAVESADFRCGDFSRPAAPQPWTPRPLRSTCRLFRAAWNPPAPPCTRASVCR